MAGFTASWVHGNALVAELPEPDDAAVFDFNHYGWGTQIVMRPGSDRWFHISIPTPVILDGKRLKLIRVFLQVQQIRGTPSYVISDAHLWDGQDRIAKMSNHDFKQDSYEKIPGHHTYELLQPKEWRFGVGLSFLLGGLPRVAGHFVDDSDAPVVVIGSAGADFEA